MADIEKCSGIADTGRGCHVAHLCWRHMAPSGEQQAWGPPAPDFDPRTGCSKFREIVGAGEESR